MYILKDYHFISSFEAEFTFMRERTAAATSVFSICSSLELIKFTELVTVMFVPRRATDHLLRVDLNVTGQWNCDQIKINSPSMCQRK